MRMNSRRQQPQGVPPPEAIHAMKEQVAAMKEAVEGKKEQVKGLGLLRHGIDLWRESGSFTREAMDNLTEGLHLFVTNWARSVAQDQQEMEKAIYEGERLLAQIESGIVIPNVAIVPPSGSSN